MASDGNGGPMSPFPDLGFNLCALIYLVPFLDCRRSYQGANCPLLLMIKNKWRGLLVDSLTLFLIVGVSFLFVIYQAALKWAFQNTELLWDLGSLKARSQPWALLALWVEPDWNIWTSGQAIPLLTDWVLPCCYRRCLANHETIKSKEVGPFQTDYLYQSLQSARYVVNVTRATHSQLNSSKQPNQLCFSNYLSRCIIDPVCPHVNSDTVN